MKRRNTYTLTGGGNMQRRTLGEAMRYLVVVCALASAFARVGCGGDGGGDGAATTTSNVSNASVPVNATTVQAVVGQQVTIPNGSIFDPAIGNNPVTFTFTDDSPATFSLTRGSSTASGDVAFGSCTLTVTLSGFPAGQGPQVGKVINFTTCSIQITASNVTVGSGAVSGTLTLTLSGPSGSSTSIAITVQVSILNNGTLVINGVATGITISGTTGTTGTGGNP
jgi:hypothetical protein